MVKIRILIIICLIVLGSARAQEDIFTITRQSFNTSMFDETAPVIYNNGLVYTSNRMNIFFRTLKNKDTKESLFNMYYTAPIDSSKWSIPKLFAKNITTPFNEGNPTFNKEGNMMIFSQNQITDTFFINNFFGDNPVILYQADKNGNKWKNKLPLTFIKKGYNYLQPFLYKDTVLFFASDIPGGYGGTDIYKSVMKNGKWSEPENAGPEVNSVANELYPFYHETNRLFFSSNRDKDDYDIFYSDFTDQHWKKAVAFPKPLNSSSDDFSFICDSNQTTGYFSSNREGSDDIYHFKMNWPVFNECDSLQKNNYCFTFFEKSDYDLDTMPLRYEWNIAGLIKIRGLTADYCFDGPGMYKIELNIIDTLSGEIFYNQASYNFNIQDIEQVYIDCKDSAGIKEKISFDGKKTNIANFEADQYFWEFGDGEKATGITTTHKYEKPGNYTVMLGVKAKPGSIVSQVCVNKDIRILEHILQTDTLLATETHVVQNYKQDDLQHDTTDISKYNEKGQNDIVEDKIYKVEVAHSEEQIPLEDEIFDALKDIYSVVENYVSSDNSYSYTVGNEPNISAVYPIYLKAKSLGYQDVQVKSFNIVPDSITVSDTLAKVILNQLLSQWKNIHFAYNAYEVSPESFEMLDKVYNVLNKYNSLIIEIAAHTDDLGSDQYNLDLSEKRAKAVFEYLVKKGIAPERLIPKGYGKSRLLNKSRTDQARAENRRVEFIVIKTGVE